MKHVYGRVVVITGASAGIGRECALQLAARGYRVVAAARRIDRLNALAEEIILFGGLCLPVQTDVSDEAAVDALLNQAVGKFGRVDVWINNAGFGQLASIEQTNASEMRRLMDVNYMGAFFGCRAAVRHMRPQGSGHILNISSMGGKLTMPLSAGYSATKHALNALTEALEIELTGSGIRVSCIMPSFTSSEFSDVLVRKIEGGSKLSAPIAKSAQVARRIVRCVERPRSAVMMVPLAPILLAFFGLFPFTWRAIGRYWVRIQSRP